MIPLYLDPRSVRVAIIGRGDLAVRRVNWLRAGGAEPEVWSDAPSPQLSATVGAALNLAFPNIDEIKRYAAIWIADLPAGIARAIADFARGAGVLVNVEDVPALCDFHTPAIVRRGKLTLAAGTGGASPAVARAARERLEATFAPGWELALEDIAVSRAALREQGASGEALSHDARTRLAAHGLM